MFEFPTRPAVTVRRRRFISPAIVPAVFAAIAVLIWALGSGPSSGVAVGDAGTGARTSPTAVGSSGGQAATDPTEPTDEASPAADVTTSATDAVPESGAEPSTATTTPGTTATAPTTRAPAPAASRPACASAVAGCVGTWTTRPQTCLPHAPTSAADYQRAFDDRRVWAGADVAKTVTLPDGRVVWLFGDTLTGLSATGGMAGPMLRNSLVVQQDRCFTFLHGGTAAAPETPLPASAHGAWFWPTSATVDEAGNALRIVGKRLIDDPGAMFGWRVVGTDVVTLRASDLGFVSVVPAPVPQGDATTWNGSALTTGGYTYIYAFVKDHQIVARTTPATMATHRWEFWNAAGWTTDLSHAEQPPIEHAPAAEFTIVPHGGGFLASAKRAEMNSDDVSAWYSTSPLGPWRYAGRAASTYGQGSTFITYAGQVVRLPGAGLVVVWSQNDRTGNPNFDFRNYGPRFSAPAAGSVP